MKFLKVITLVTTMSLVIFMACKSGSGTGTASTDDAVKEMDCSVITYTASIKPILDSRCIKCHSGPKPKHNINLSHWEGTKEAVDHELMCVITFEENCPKMPPLGQRLNAVEVQTIDCWIQNGMPE